MHLHWQKIDPKTGKFENVGVSTHMIEGMVAQVPAGATHVVVSSHEEPQPTSTEPAGRQPTMGH